MFIVLITCVMILGETSNALQCYQCTGKKTDNTNPRLYDKWKKLAYTSGVHYDNIDSPPICTDQDDLGSSTNCTAPALECTYFVFKDENVKDIDGEI